MDYFEIHRDTLMEKERKKEAYSGLISTQTGMSQSNIRVEKICER